MKKSGWRLVLSAVLFASWIGYLAYLAATTTQPIVLSRPQFLSADLYVVADIPADSAAPDQPASTVVVKQVIWAANAEDKDRKTLHVIGLRSLKNLKKELDRSLAESKSEKGRSELESRFAVEKSFVWDGDGQYILALSRSKEDPNLFTVTGLPRTPGFNGEPGRIYPATPTTLRQLELLAKEYHP